MPRHRFHAPPAQISAGLIALATEEAHHLSRVLRLGPGARVYVFDGAGQEYECVVKSAERGGAQLEILRRLEDEVESPLRLTLAQALVKHDKFDWIVQKSTELGVTRIVPLLTEHAETHRGEERNARRIERWRRVALEALKQCGRRRLVEIIEPLEFPRYLAGETSELKLIFHERGGGGLAPSSVASVALAIGPEGGWSEAESTLALAHGFAPIHLGPRILRAETAAIAAITLAQHLAGDLR
jgi:16S rRNA (uracil1498-N3)-methyltransferase